MPPAGGGLLSVQTGHLAENVSGCKFVCMAINVALMKHDFRCTYSLRYGVWITLTKSSIEHF